MRWATRAGIHVDRSCSAWLISRFVDPEAEFIYVDDPDDVPDGTTAFDMVGAELSHRGRDVTFETVLRVYGLDDPILWRIAEVVHEADVDDGRYDAPAAPGLELIIGALAANHDDEGVRLLVATILTSIETSMRDRARGG